MGLSFWALLALVFAGALMDMPGNAARQSTAPRLADMAGTSKERANSATRAVRQLSLFAGPPLAGILVAWIGAVSVLWLNAASFAVSASLVALAVTAVQATPCPSSGESERCGTGGYAAELKEGLGFLGRDRPVFAIVSAAVTQGGPCRRCHGW